MLYLWHWMWILMLRILLKIYICSFHRCLELVIVAWFWFFSLFFSCPTTVEPFGANMPRYIYCLLVAGLGFHPVHLHSHFLPELKPYFNYFFGNICSTFRRMNKAAALYKPDQTKMSHLQGPTAWIRPGTLSQGKLISSYKFQKGWNHNSISLTSTKGQILTWCACKVNY